MFYDHLSLNFLNRIFFYQVCNAGFYKNGRVCVLCPDNRIKALPGNATRCDDDTACDGKSYVPNSEHTACGNLSHVIIKLIPFIYH